MTSIHMTSNKFLQCILVLLTCQVLYSHALSMAQESLGTVRNLKRVPGQSEISRGMYIGGLIRLHS
jgi:hypothetical protein